VAAAFFATSGGSGGGQLPKEFIHEGLREVVMHEVGHTLGLRHNFKASAWKTLDEINDRESGRKEGTVASVMDYSPPNLSPDRDKQGLYYSQTIGPYDYWAIEYGYRPIAEKVEMELKKIAARSTEPALGYSTDEDSRVGDPDPLSTRFDLGKDPLAYVRRQMEISTQSMPKVVDRTVQPGEGYQRARQAFHLLFDAYWQSATVAARFPGGIYISRDHKKGDDASTPLSIVPAETQREAMKLIVASVFDPPPIDGQQLNYLAASRWSHWGTEEPKRLDYPIHDEVLSKQEAILSQLLSSVTLERILDNEFKTPEDQKSYTLAEHLRLITDGIFSDWGVAPKEKKYDDRNPLISSFRRNLQRQAIRRLASLVTQSSSAPGDARNLTRMHLTRLRKQAQTLLDSKTTELDDYTRAHLADAVARIDAVLTAELTLPSLN
jgi:hypothetical protein